MTESFVFEKCNDGTVLIQVSFRGKVIVENKYWCESGRGMEFEEFLKKNRVLRIGKE